jgi:hypothetical protein
VTIAISIKINDGLVLATDSASTLLGIMPNGQLSVLNVYNNANKLFNLRKGFPIGAITWGAGSIGQSSISTIIKDLRLRFSGEDKSKLDWKLDKDSYTVADVAAQLKKYVFDELYTDIYKDAPQHQKPAIGFIVAGYSAKEPMAEEFQIDIQNGGCTGPRSLRKQEDSGATWAGEVEALNRLIMGYATNLYPLLQAQLKVSPSEFSQAVSAIQPQMQIPFVLPAMPLQDAIDLAEYMVELTIEFSRHKPGPPTVGGPVEIAAISKHEGFRWVKRKYYFESKLNPREEFKRIEEPEKKGKDAEKEENEKK